MVRDRSRGARVHVRARAHLERHAPVADERRQPAKLHRAVIADVDVVDDADAVAQPLGAAELERLPDRRETERLAGVDRDVEVLATNAVEGVEVTRRPIPLLGTGDVEADHAGITPTNRTFGDLDRAGRLAHRRDEQPHLDRPARLAALADPRRNPSRIASVASSRVRPRSVHSSGAIRTSA